MDVTNSLTSKEAFRVNMLGATDNKSGSHKGALHPLIIPLRVLQSDNTFIGVLLVDHVATHQTAKLTKQSGSRIQGAFSQCRQAFTKRAIKAEWELHSYNFSYKRVLHNKYHLLKLKECTERHQLFFIITL